MCFNATSGFLMLYLVKVKQHDNKTFHFIHTTNYSIQHKPYFSCVLYKICLSINKLIITQRDPNESAAGSLSWNRPQSSIPIVMFTGFTGPELTQYRQDLIGLNGVMANQCCKATHLVVKKSSELLRCSSASAHAIILCRSTGLLTVKQRVDLKTRPGMKS